MLTHGISGGPAGGVAKEHNSTAHNLQEQSCSWRKRWYRKEGGRRWCEASHAAYSSFREQDS